jgi:uncharacterized membrane protein YgcG
MNTKNLGTLILLFVINISLFGLQYPDKPKDFVTDLGGYLTPAQLEILNEKLANYEKEEGNQLFILIAKSAENRDFNELTSEIANKWKIGKLGKENSIFLVIYIEDKKARFDVGSALQSYITEGIATHIRVQEMNPLLKQNKFFEAIDVGSESLILATLGTYTNTEIDDMDGEGGWSAYSELIVPYFIISIFTVIFLFVQGYFILINLPALSRLTNTKKYIFLGAIILYIIVFSMFFYNSLIGILTHNNTNIGIAIISLFPAAFGMAITIAISENVLATTYTSKGKKLRINRKPFSSGNTYSSSSDWSTGNSYGAGGSGGDW